MGNVTDLRPGDAQTFQSYDELWANVSNAPFRLFKHFVPDGGISTPLVAHWPAGFNPRSPAHAACHVLDILPTILEATGSAYRTELNNLIAKAPQCSKDMAQQYAAWAVQSGVMDWNEAPPKLLAMWKMDTVEGWVDPFKQMRSQ